MRRVKEEIRSRGYLVGLLGATALILAGCNGTEDTINTGTSNITGPTVTLPKMNDPADLASASADIYDDNNFGLITGSTLARWISNWPVERPVGVEGKLIILQNSAGEAGSEYIASDPANGVFTYLAPMVNELRSNGVVMTKSMVPSGQTMDNFLSKYNIDPTKDMVVCAQGLGSGQPVLSAVMGAGRCWYTFRYWGMPKGLVSVLNGSNVWNKTANALPMMTTANTPPETGLASVKDLPQINFALQATLEDMMNVIPSTDTNVLDDGVFIWDARSSNQYVPTQDSDYQSGPAQGHPNGALDLNFTALLNATVGEGYTYKTKAEISKYLTGETSGFLNSSLQLLGAGEVYQPGDVIYTYCETTYRAMITGFATAAILGLPTRFYDGAMTEWHSMSHLPDNQGNMILPYDSPWRTDKVQVSMFRERDDLTHANNVPVTVVDAYSNTAHGVIIEDLAYKGIIVDMGTDSGSSDTSSGGGALPANPCGG